jgi:hypothetical protein
MPRAPPIITPPPVLRPDWKTLAWLAFRRSKPPDLDMCPAPNHPPIGFVAQLINSSPLSFEAQTKKPSWWFWSANHQTVAAGFETQTRKPSPLALRPNQRKTSRPVLRSNHSQTISVVLRSNHWQTIPVVLRPNHWQTIDLSFEAQPRNSCSLSPCSWYRPHTVSSDLPIILPPSIQPVSDHPWSSTPGLLLLPRSSSLPAMSHLPPAHHETSKHDSPNKIR